MTQQEKIVGYMIQHAAIGQKFWFYPPDFMQPEMPFDHPYFVGYEASARLSELAKEYPDLVESRRKGKYIERRLRIENITATAKKIGGEFGDFIIRKLAQYQMSVGIDEQQSPLL